MNLYQLYYGEVVKEFDLIRGKVHITSGSTPASVQEPEHDEPKPPET